jgi:hypothetical protein
MQHGAKNLWVDRYSPQDSGSTAFPFSSGLEDVKFVGGIIVTEWLTHHRKGSNLL